jgi:peptidoglycan/xylan/chitin deacetylase (PgdA/CDA1 family)
MFALTRVLHARAAHEVYALSIIYLALTACFLAAFVPWWAAILLAQIVIQIPMYVVGLVVLPRKRINLTEHSRVLMALLIAACLWLRTWPAYAFLALVAANAIAALTMRRFLLGFAAAAPFSLLYDWRFGIAIVVLSHLLIVYVTLVPNCQWLGPVITSFDTQKKEVWLTIDDGPASDTNAIREMLARRNAAATFFEVGVNHSMTHPSATFWCLGPRRLAEEIGHSRWFRAPVGMKNPFVHPLLTRRGLTLIGWSVRGFDSFGDDVERVVRRIVPRVRAGSIIVMHQGRGFSVACVSRVIDELKARGYTFVIPSFERLKTNR